MFVKVCGTTTEEDALLAVAMGADALGFIFAPSPRQVAPGRVADIVKRLPPEIITVGVFQDEAAQRVVEIVNATGLKAAQLSGHESPEVTRWIADRVYTIKAFRAGSPDIADGASYGARAVMIDSPRGGGSGEVFDWRLADGAPSGIPLILAGGLNAENVAEAIAAVRPWGVDAATGVEASPGKKDPRKLRAFVAAAKAAAPVAAADIDGGPYDWRMDRR